uniref:SFRICE_024464 n=1 Tax=Spodoptera frugiperda TaxID=7108 RepID=A0A2H1W6F3_SPOFR
MTRQTTQLLSSRVLLSSVKRNTKEIYKCGRANLWHEWAGRLECYYSLTEKERLKTTLSLCFVKWIVVGGCAKLKIKLSGVPLKRKRADNGDDKSPSNSAAKLNQRNEINGKMVDLIKYMVFLGIAQTLLAQFASLRTPHKITPETALFSRICRREDKTIHGYYIARLSQFYINNTRELINQNIFPIANEARGCFGDFSHLGRGERECQSLTDEQVPRSYFCFSSCSHGNLLGSPPQLKIGISPAGSHLWWPDSVFMAGGKSSKGEILPPWARQEGVSDSY